MPISEEIISRIIDSIDIVDFIGEYLRLRKTGRNFSAVCPFHKEKTPSFIVSPDKQIFHCFGCHTGGNVFGFLMKIENISYPEAIRKLAQKLNIHIDERKIGTDRNYEEKKKLFNLYEDVCGFYQNIFKSSSNAEKARSYLLKRDISKDTIEKFRIGFASGENSLLDWGIKKGYSAELLIKSGLVNQAKRDHFKERVIFPIFDGQGKVVAFGGRVLVESETSPKYINSPESLIYTKGRNLYGLNFAKESLMEKNNFIIFEGYIDLITAHSYGVTNSVATLGTALTVEHSRIIKRYVADVFLIYDPDIGGKISSIRSADVLLENDINVGIVTLPDGLDPDEFLKKYGTENFFNCLNKAVPLVEYVANISVSKNNVRTSEGKIKVVKDVLPYIAKIENLVLLKEEIKKLALKLNIDENALLVELKKLKGSSYNKKKTLSDRPIREGTELMGNSISCDLELIAVLLKYPSFVDLVIEEVGSDDLEDVELKNIFEKIIESHRLSHEIKISDILGLCSERNSNILSELVLKNIPYDRTSLLGLTKIIRQRRQQRDFKKAQDEFQKLLKEGKVDKDKFEEFKELSRIVKGGRCDGK